MSLPAWPRRFPAGNVLVALAAAASWGGGDFAGGMGVKSAGGSTVGALRVVVIAHVTSLCVLLGVLLFQGAPLPTGAPVFWALAGGITAGLSIVAFYLALARGAMGASAAVSGLLAAAIPAAVSSALEGRPGTLQIAGFLLAGAAIWAIAATPAPSASTSSHTQAQVQAQRGVMALAIAGGLGFGVYFVALRLANPLGVLRPLVLARIGSSCTCGLLLLVWPRGRAVKGAAAVRSGNMRATVLWASGVAVLDTGGNLLFILSTQMGRLDVASVLASLYPAATILLAAWQLGEKPTRQQLAGMAAAFAAILMITG